jgi:glycine oxidase
VTAEGKTRRQVVVLGSGVAGLSIAWQLARRGGRPLVIAGQRPAASLAAAGLLAPMAEVSTNPGLGRFAAESLRQYPEVLAELGDDAAARVGFARTGILRLAYGDAAAAALRDEVGAYEAAGIPSRWLDARGCGGEVPGLGLEGLSGGLLTFDEAQVQPRWLLDELRGAAAAAGAEFLDADALDVAETGGVVRIATTQVDVECEHCVVAAGSWVNTLRGVEHLVRPVKGQLLVFPDAVPPARILYLGNRYLLGKPDGSVILGATVEDAGFSLEPDAGAESLRELLPKLWPALVGADAEVRVGLRPAAPDGLPVMGPLPGSPRIYCFTAHHRNGFLLAPPAARIAAVEVLEGRLHEELSRFRPGRFP